MLKFLVISFLIGFVIFKVIGLFFRLLLGGSPNQQYSQNRNQHSSRKSTDGNVNVDYVPNKKSEKKEQFKGGEYVDYEEIE